MLNKLNRNTTRLVIEGIAIGLAFFLSYQIRYDGKVPFAEKHQFWVLVLAIIAGRLITNTLFGLYRHKWRYINMLELVPIAQAYATFSALLVILRLVVPPASTMSVLRLGGGLITLEFLLSQGAAVSLRVLRRYIYMHRHKTTTEPHELRRLLLVGAGVHGTTLAKEMVLNKSINLIGFVDDDSQKIGSVIAGVPVFGPISSLTEIAKKHRADDVLICIPPAARAGLKLDPSGQHSFRTRVAPTLDEILGSKGNDGVIVGETLEPGSGKPRSSNGHFHKPAVAAKEYPHTSISNKTILITGGAGFIGSTVAEKLVPNNEVILFDLAFRNKPIQFTNLLDHPNVRMIEGDLLESQELLNLCATADMVVHAAAVVGVSRVCNAGRETLETNYVGTSRLLRALANNKKLQRLIYFSTSEVFGVNSFRVTESTSPSIGPISETRWSYAIAKLAGEHLVQSYYRETGMPVAIIRPFNVFGPRRTGEHAMMRFILDALSGSPLRVHGDGSQIRSWCYIEDFCAALLQMLEKPAAIGEDFNIGHPGNTITIYELARKVVELSETNTPIQFVEHPFPDISIRVPSLTKAQNLLDYRPRYDLDSATILTIDWYRKHHDFFVRPQAAMAANA
jgi:dTDP-glucose 4,6-dehydratase